MLLRFVKDAQVNKLKVQLLAEPEDVVDYCARIPIRQELATDLGVVCMGEVTGLVYFTVLLEVKAVGVDRNPSAGANEMKPNTRVVWQPQLATVMNV